MVPAWRDEQLQGKAGLHDIKLFYVGMVWRGWVAYV